MAEQTAHIGDIDLAYETFGDPGDPALLLVMGLATQMVAWHEDFCGELAAHGLFVIRFDNRDVGRSSRMDGMPVPSMRQIIMRDRKAAGYTLSDLAADAVGLLDHLGISRAHVVGASMGGMVAQTIAIEHPDRVLSLCSIMSNTGSRWSGQPKLATYRVLLGVPPKEREAFIEHVLATYRIIGSKGFDRDEEDLRRVAGLSYDRGRNPAGSGRQLGAIVASGDRTAKLRGLDVPAVVIHGTIDRLVGFSGGKATAKAIPGARFVPIAGMGHDLPRGAWPTIIRAITENAARASAPIPPDPAHAR
jgi:pimeloyl-ACP methyl ester carboxylesterase